MHLCERICVPMENPIDTTGTSFAYPGFVLRTLLQDRGLSDSPSPLVGKGSKQHREIEKEPPEAHYLLVILWQKEGVPGFWSNPIWNPGSGVSALSGMNTVNSLDWFCILKIDREMEKDGGFLIHSQPPELSPLYFSSSSNSMHFGAHLQKASSQKLPGWPSKRSLLPC